MEINLVMPGKRSAIGVSACRVRRGSSENIYPSLSWKLAAQTAAVLCCGAISVMLLGGCASTGSESGLRPGRQQSLNEWRRLADQSVRTPRVFVSHREVRFYFWPQTNRAVEFRAKLNHHRLPAEGYQVDSGPLLLQSKPSPMPLDSHEWHEAKVIVGAEWHNLATNLIATLTPQATGHGAYYRGLLGGAFLYRDPNGRPQFAAVDASPQGVTIDHRFSIEETLQILARLAAEQLAKTYPQESIFVLMAPNSRHFPQPLLVDRPRSQCIWLSPVDFYHSTEPGHVVTGSARSIGSLLFEAHGLALIKNPVSSAGRLLNLVVGTTVGLLRLPLPGPPVQIPEVTPTRGMDLAQWNAWLDRHTHTHQEKGSIRLIVDGERFFPELEHAIAKATNSIHFELFIFDNDDVATAIADQLKSRSQQVSTRMIPDRLATIAAALVPPVTHPPTNFSPPVSMTSYLKKDSKVYVHPFLNPFCSYDHTKIYLIDGQRAWMGGMNIGREYRYEWHDMMVELEGPIVNSLENGFRRDWAHASLAGDLAYLFALLRPPKKVNTCATSETNSFVNLRLLPTKTLWKPYCTAVLGSIRQARSYVYVENPYLFDKRVITAMVKARSRGVDVRAVLPRTNDSRTASHAELVIANYLLEHGVGVYFYPGMTHVKAMLVDDWALVGSGNLNAFGLRLCQESNVATSDPTFARQLKHDIFEVDFNHSFQLTAPVSTEWMDWLADVAVEGL